MCPGGSQRIMTAEGLYTRSRRPVTLAWCQGFPTKHEAMHWEWQIKQWTKKKKEKLCREQLSLTDEGG